MLNQMNNNDIQQIIKETVAHAKNSFFSEDSKLADHILQKMGGHIESTIDKKLKPLEDKLDNYIVSDNKWKEEAQPVIEMGKNVQGFGKVSLYILGFVTSVSAGFYAFMELFRKH